MGARYCQSEAVLTIAFDGRFEPASRQTTPDFLVSVTDPNARTERLGAMAGIIPRTGAEFAAYFRHSDIGTANRDAVSLYEDRRNTVISDLFHE